ncbi:MAG: hypothetical protein HC837_08335 [Chloroflexaceae bacterium]|nr:hypothetical protein [Chloroflexaceae bacterium]
MTMQNEFMEQWFKLMNQAMMGNSDAQEAVRSMTVAPIGPDQMLRWMTRFMPSAGMPVKPDVLEDWLENYWKMMGVVPRHRYLDLLERHEQLRIRLEESEKTVQQLRGVLGTTGQQEQARKVMDMWGTMMQDAIRAQTDMMRAWMPHEQHQIESQESSATPSPDEKSAT